MNIIMDYCSVCSDDYIIYLLSTQDHHVFQGIVVLFVGKVFNQ